MDIWLSAVGEYGFPLVITFYLLHRIEKKLDTLNASVVKLQRLTSADFQSVKTRPAYSKENPSSHSHSAVNESR